MQPTNPEGLGDVMVGASAQSARSMVQTTAESHQMIRAASLLEHLKGQEHGQSPLVGIHGEEEIPC